MTETHLIGMLLRRGVANILIADFVLWAAFGLYLLCLLHGILLHNVGITVAIEDFGYSSLSYPRDFPADQLKIDRSFVQNLYHERNDANIARHDIDMAHEVGLTIIAEGVETAEQHPFLRSNGCDELQGLLISKPLTTEEFGRLLREGRNSSTEFEGDAGEMRALEQAVAPEPWP